MLLNKENYKKIPLFPAPDRVLVLQEFYMLNPTIIRTIKKFKFPIVWKNCSQEGQGSQNNFVGNMSQAALQYVQYR